MAALRPVSITQLDVTSHRLQVRPAAIGAGANGAAIEVEARRLGDLLVRTVKRPPTPTWTLVYRSERQLLGYAAVATDFLVLELPRHMRAYDRRAVGLAMPILTIHGFQMLRMTRRRPSGHVTGSFAESICIWTFRQLGLAPNRSFRRISQTMPKLIAELCPDFLVWRDTAWLPCEAKHVVSDRYLRRAANRGFTQVLGAMAGLAVARGYLFVAIDGPASGARYRAELVELHV